MGTRGVYGFYKNSESKLTYNHFDSYLECLGQSVVDFIQSSTIEELNEICDKIILVEEDGKPTNEQIKECNKWLNTTVSSQSASDWYCLLRNAQGKLDSYKNGLRYMIDSKEFIKDSLFCEYGYIINLDKNTLEIYEGFQHKPNNSRYVYKNNENGYYNCKQICEFSLIDIPYNWMEIVNDMIEKEEAS